MREQHGSWRPSHYGRMVRAAALVPLMLGLTAGVARGAESVNLVNNGGFENGTNGWMWEQWENKPLPGLIDTQDHKDGSASFKMGLAGSSGVRYMAQEIPLNDAGKDYVLTFWLRAKDIPANAAHMRVGIDGHGWLGAETGQIEAVQTGGTFDWKQFTVPIPASSITGSKKLTLFFYDDHVEQGVVNIDGIELKPAESNPAAPTKGKASPPEEKVGNLLNNGGFEDGSSGWMWEQWENRPLPGVVDKQDHARGSASFKMGLPGASGGRYLAQEIQIKQPGKDHLLTFWLKPTDVPANAAHVRIGIDGHGWLGAEVGKPEVVQTGGTSDWKEYKIPIPATIAGESKKFTLFFYHDQMGQGTLGIDGVTLKAISADDLAAMMASGGEPTLLGDTSHPALSTFAQGDKVELTFTAVGLSGEKSPLNLVLNIVDEHDQPVESREIPVQIDKAGHWKTTVVAPSTRLGFYRVKAKLSDGVELKAMGTRQAGFLTYAVVPDPTHRVDYGEQESRFAMQGGFGPWGEESLAYLGARWVLDGSFEWKKNEPNHAGEFADAVRTGKLPDEFKTPKWHTYPLPTLMNAPSWAVVPDTNPYMTGVLTPDGEKAWADYCKLAAEVYVKRFPNLPQHIYQITWEPIYPWGFKGRPEDLVRIYEIAYPILHATDPKAVVAGPTRGIDKNDVESTVPLLRLGLGKYIDMYSCHPYYSIDAEKDGMPHETRRMKQALEQYTGKKLEMIGTEQGWTTQEELGREMTQAHGLLRQNLITLGEGFRFNFAYYIVDYRLYEQKGFGYYYNLVEGVPWAPAKASPRPIAPAYAAQSFLLDGHKSAGAIEWLGDTAWGYAFQRKDHIVLALWDYGDKPRPVSIPTGVDQVQVYDWMGNAQTVSSSSGCIQVTLGPEPIYVAGVAPAIWGAGAEKMLMVDKDQLQVFPGDHLVISGRVQTPTGKPLQGKVVLDADSRLGLKAQPLPVSADAGKPTPYQFDLAVPANANPGTYPLKLLLQGDAGNLAAAGARVRLASPVAITSIDPAILPGGTRGVAVTLFDEQGKGMNGALDMELANVPDSHQRIGVSLAPGATQRVVLKYPKLDIPAWKLCQAKATITAGSGYKFSQAEPVDFLTASHLTNPVTLDGTTAKWSNVPAVRLAGKDMVIRSAEYFKDRFAAQVRYAWDEKALYVVADVDDEAFYQPNTGVEIWRGDCLQLAFNLDPRKKEALTANLLDTNIRRRATEINVALTKNGPEAYRSVTFDPANVPLAPLSSDQVKMTIKQAKGRLIYEIAISWKALGADTAPKEGDLIGVAAAVNNMDSAEQKDPTALGLFGGIVPTKDSEKFGLLLLGGK